MATRKKLRFDRQACLILGALGLANERTGATIHFDDANVDANVDAGESLFILQELQAIEQRLYETPFGLLKSEKLIPFDLSIPLGAKEWGYDRVTGFGISQWMAADARDLPMTNVKRVRVTFPIEWHDAAYRYTIRDLQAAMMSGMPLEDMEARQARRAIDQFRNKVLLRGDDEKGFTGLINDPTVTQDTVSNGAWDGSAATPDQIIKEFNQVIFLIGALTKENYWPDTLAVPARVYAYLTTTPRSSTSDTTIWAYMRDNNDYIKSLEMLLDLGAAADEGGFAPGVGGTGRAIFYKRDSEVVVAKIAEMFAQLAPQQRGMAYEVPCYGAFGGTHFRVPIAAYYLDGVLPA